MKAKDLFDEEDYKCIKRVIDLFEGKITAIYTEKRVIFESKDSYRKIT